MKKLLVVLAALLAFVSVFAESQPVTGTVTYAGTASFTLVFDQRGLDVYSLFSQTTLSVSWAPSGDTKAGFTFSLVGLPTGLSLNITKAEFSNNYFGLTWKSKIGAFDKYISGTDYDGNAKVTSDGVLITLPAVNGLTVYYADLATEVTGVPTNTIATIWFEDMAAVKYEMSPFTFVAGTYNVGGNKDTYEFGGSVEGTVDLGVVKPQVRAFAGLVEGATGMELAYDAYATANYEIKPITITPTVRFAEKLDKLDYVSDYVYTAKSQYVQVAVNYKDTFAPVTVDVTATPKYDMTPATPKFTLAFKTTVSAEIKPLTVSVYYQDADLLVTDTLGKLEAKASYSDEMVFGSVTYTIPELTDAATATLHVTAQVTPVKELAVSGNFRLDTKQNKNGWNAQADYTIAPSTTFTFWVGNLTRDADGNYTVFNPDVMWYGKLVYKASF